MRSNSKKPVNVLWRSLVWLCAVFLLLTCPFGMAVEYDAGTAITNVSITNPVADEVWLAGSPHTLTCTTSTDTDRECETYWYDVNDSVTHYWTGTGTFKDNHYIGTSVTYICSNTAESNTVIVYADDNYTADNNTAIVDEQAKSDSKTVTVILPIVTRFGYTGSVYITGASSPEFIKDERNDPKVFRINDSNYYVTATLSGSGDNFLTEASSVTVKAEPSDLSIGSFIGNGELVANEQPWGFFTCAGTRESAPSSVDKLTFAFVWRYNCPTGSNVYIQCDTTSGHVMYTVLDSPVRTDAAVVFDYSCGYCKGFTNSKSGEDACDAVLAEISTHYTYNWDCYQLSSNFDRLVGAQGVTATQQKWACKSSGYAVDDLITMKSITIDPIPAGAGGGGSDKYEWWYHQWSGAVSKTWDPSSNTKRSGAWADYEDHVFADYERVTGLSPVTTVWLGSNPGGQTADHQNTITHSNPAPSAFTEP